MPVMSRFRLAFALYREETEVRRSSLQSTMEV